MKKLLFALCVTALLSPMVAAQTLTPQEINQAVRYLEKTRNDVIAATKGLSDAQWNFKPASNRWSVAQCTEHIAAAEDFLLTMVQRDVMKAPGRTNAADVAAIDEFVLKNIPDRTRKVQAPEPLQPSNRFGSPKDSLKHFRQSRRQTIAFLKKTKDLRQHAVRSPIGQEWDGYQWLLMIAAHSERHTRQINEVKAEPMFPKK